MHDTIKHIVLIIIATTLAVLLFYIGDLTWLGSSYVTNGFLASQGYHELCLLLLLIPIIYASIVFRIRGGITLSVLASLAILPHAFHFSPYPDPFFRLAAFSIIGMLIAGIIGRELNSNEELRRAHNRLEQFLSQTISTQERERQYLARELHDESAQALVDTTHKIDELMEIKNLDYSNYMEMLRELHNDVESILEGTRRFIGGLRPPLLDEMGLGQSLKWLAHEVANEYDIEMRTDIQDHKIRLTKFHETNLFRIAQEALTNARKHSKANRVYLSLTESDNSIQLRIEDNGIGFRDTDQDRLLRKGKFGIIGIKERVRLAGSTVNIHSSVGKGTTVIVEIPADKDI